MAYGSIHTEVDTYYLMSEGSLHIDYIHIFDDRGQRTHKRSYTSSDARVVVVAFFLACEDFGRMFDHSFPACAVFLFFFFKWKLTHAH